MKKLISLSLVTVMLLALFCAGATVGAQENGELAVYPYDPFSLYGKVQMTPNGGFVMAGSLGSSQTLLVFAVTNDFTFDYESAPFIHFVGFRANCHTEIKADFYDTLDGYSYPETLVYSTDGNESGDDLVLNLKKIMTEAGKWNPAGNLLYLQIIVNHSGEEGKYAAAEYIRLGGETLASREESVTPIKVNLETATTDNISFSENTLYPDGFNFVKSDYQAGGHLRIGSLKSDAAHPYLYICMSDIASNNWPYFYIIENGTTVAGGGKSLIRVRPECGAGTIWTRIDLSCLSSPDAEFTLQLSLETPAGASTYTNTVGAIVLAGDSYSNDTSLTLPSGGQTDEPEISVPKNDPTKPGETVSKTEESASESAVSVAGDTSDTSASNAEKAKTDAIIRYISGGVLVIALTILAVHMIRQKKKGNAGK